MAFLFEPPPVPQVMKEEAVQSPCISVCALDDADLCIGCYRSGREISRWAEMSRAEKLATLETAAKRRQAKQSISLD